MQQQWQMMTDSLNEKQCLEMDLLHGHRSIYQGTSNKGTVHYGNVPVPRKSLVKTKKIN
jgi:hypothetical protein